MEHRRQDDRIPVVQPLVFGQVMDDLVDLFDDPVRAGPVEMVAEIQPEAKEKRSAAVITMEFRHRHRMVHILPHDLVRKHVIDLLPDLGDGTDAGVLVKLFEGERYSNHRVPFLEQVI